MPAWNAFWRRRAWEVARAIGMEYLHAQTRYGCLLNELIRRGAAWLDIGCGRQIVPSWALPERVRKDIIGRAGCIVGIDFDDAIRDHPDLHERVIASGYDLPFAGGTFDVVSANMVMEHVDQPVQLLKEVERVLKPGGRFLCVTPNVRAPLVRSAVFVPDGLKKRIVWYLENRHADDVFPTFYRFNDTRSIRSAVSACGGLRVEDLRLMNTITSLTKLGPFGIVDILMMRYGPEEWRPNILCVLAKEG